MAWVSDVGWVTTLALVGLFTVPALMSLGTVLVMRLPRMRNCFSVHLTESSPPFAVALPVLAGFMLALGVAHAVGRFAGENRMKGDGEGAGTARVENRAGIGAAEAQHMELITLHDGIFMFLDTASTEDAEPRLIMIPKENVLLVEVGEEPGQATPLAMPVDAEETRSSPAPRS